MEKVTGIGGVFFKVQDPQRMAAWYQEHLGIQTEDGHADFTWRDKDHPETVGRTVWSLFPADTDNFGSSSAQFMINYRVSNLERMLDQLRQAGVSVEKVEDYDYGRFAWITDPERQSHRALGAQAGLNKERLQQWASNSGGTHLPTNLAKLLIPEGGRAESCGLRTAKRTPSNAAPANAICMPAIAIVFNDVDTLSAPDYLKVHDLECQDNQPDNGWDTDNEERECQTKPEKPRPQLWTGIGTDRSNGNFNDPAERVTGVGENRRQEQGHGFDGVFTRFEMITCVDGEIENEQTNDSPGCDEDVEGNPTRLPPDDRLVRADRHDG